MDIVTIMLAKCEKVVGHLKADFKEALAALRSLHDEQNGTPLERKQWEAAQSEAIRVLKKHGV